MCHYNGVASAPKMLATKMITSNVDKYLLNSVIFSHHLLLFAFRIRIFVHSHLFTSCGETQMIATLDRLMALSQKVRDAERTSEREPIYVALELNEVRLIERMIESYLGEFDPYATSSTVRDAEAY